MKGKAMIGFALSAMLLLSGCGTFYETVEKNEVRVRPIGKTSDVSDGDSRLILSSETARGLAVQALGKYLDLHPAEEDMSFEVLSLDAPSVGQALDNLFLFQADIKRKYMIVDEYKDERIVSPLYFVTVSIASSGRIMVILHAETGEVLGIARKYETVGFPAANKDKADMIQTSKEYLERLGYDMTEFDNDAKLSYYGSISEIYYRNKENGEIALNVSIDARTNEVVGFLKDIMTLPFFAPYVK
ncbi:hypothetical protein [Cohnella sp. GCM10027633]|uniref:hypothetical protein n=1 Tax=unclassified Cohnella TaxID=2636738 RepID=UPI0036341C47